LGAPIVVADPFQRYRGLEIASDAPSRTERREVEYHLVGDLDLSEPSTAADFADAAHRVIDACMHAQRPVIVSGGTGLYLRAALADLRFPPPPDPDHDAWAEELATRRPDEAIATLERMAPEAARRIDRANPRRVARALAIAAGGAELPSSQGLWDGRTRHPTVLVSLTRPRDVLDRLIAIRVRRELDDGLVAELERALDRPDTCREARQIIGAREVAAIRAGELRREDLAERLDARTRRLARKQLTWLRKTPATVRIDLGERPAVEALDELLQAHRRESVRLSR
jgi:tRNA dimethylallyltransferase